MKLYTNKASMVTVAQPGASEKGTWVRALDPSVKGMLCSPFSETPRRGYPMSLKSSSVAPSPVSANAPEAAPHHEERIFLEGPRSRSWELRRVLRIAREFILGFRTLHFIGP